MAHGYSGRHTSTPALPPQRRSRRTTTAGILSGGILALAAVVAVVVVHAAGPEHHPPRAVPVRQSRGTGPAAAPAQPQAAGLVTTLPGPAALQGFAYAPSWVAMGPGSQELGYSSSLGPLLAWNVTTRQSASPAIPGMSSDSPGPLAFSPDGGTLAVGLSSGPTYLYDVAAKRLTGTLTPPEAGASFLAFSPNGTSLAVASPGPVYVWDLATSRVTATLTDPGVQLTEAEAFSPDSSLLAIGTTTGEIFIWNVATSHLAATLTDPGGDSVAAVAFSAGGGLLVAVDSDGTAYSWNVATSRLAATVTPSGGQTCATYCALSPGGTLLATGDSSGSANVLSVTTGRVTATFSDPDHVGVASMGFSPDSQVLAVADENGNVSLWRVP
jgi:WD40 repeat protein